MVATASQTWLYPCLLIVLLRDDVPQGFLSRFLYRARLRQPVTLPAGQRAGLSAQVFPRYSRNDGPQYSREGMLRTSNDDWRKRHDIGKMPSPVRHTAYPRATGKMPLASNGWAGQVALRQGLCTFQGFAHWMPLPTAFLDGRGGRVVDRAGLENRSGCKPTVGSNPTLSATNLYFLKISGRFFSGSHNSSHTWLEMVGDGSASACGIWWLR